MSTLASCLKRIGLEEHEAAIIRGAADANKADGDQAAVAAVRAVRDHIEGLLKERDAIAAQIKDVEVPAAPFTMPQISGLLQLLNKVAPEAAAPEVKAEPKKLKDLTRDEVEAAFSDLVAGDESALFDGIQTLRRYNRDHAEHIDALFSNVAGLYVDAKGMLGEQARAIVRRAQEAKQDAASALVSMSESDLESMFDELAAEIAGDNAPAPKRDAYEPFDVFETYNMLIDGMASTGLDPESADPDILMAMRRAGMINGKNQTTEKGQQFASDMSGRNGNTPNNEEASEIISKAIGRKKVEQKTKKADTEASRAASEIAKSLGVNLGSAGLEALEGLGKLFGGTPGRLNSGFTFDEDTYNKAKPHFQAALADIVAAGKDLKDFIRALIKQFGEPIKPYVMQFAQDLREEKANASASESVESDSASNAQSDTQATVLTAEPGGAGRSPGQVGDTGGRDGAGTDAGVSSGSAAADGKRGDPAVGGEKPGVQSSSAGGADNRGGGDNRTGGLFAERDADGSADSAARDAEKRIARAKVEASDKPGTVAEIKAQMPFLTDGQAADVRFAEMRFAKKEGFGVLFTNGTGTGKTFTGLGTVARAFANGKTSILIVAPKQPVVDAWVKAAEKFFGLSVKTLDGTKDNGGTGIVATTYANLASNDSLALRDWDMVVADEAHYLSSAEDGATTQALDALRALTRKRGTHRSRVNMANREKVDRMTALFASVESNRRDAKAAGGNNNTYAQDMKDQAEAEKIAGELDALYAAEEKALKAMKPEEKPRGLFLSATPFAYEKNVEWGQEFLFDYGDDTEGRSQAYNSGTPFDRFMMQHFGYRMRYNKLTAPDAKVDSGLMQRAFNSFLKREGALSSRALDSDYDYDRLFVSIESQLGRRVDDALKWLRDMTSEKDENGNQRHKTVAARDGFRDVYERIAKGSFDYHSRMYFLEAIKARESIPHIQAHLDAGRQVLVMHDFKKGGAVNPFLQSFGDAEAHAAYTQFANEFSDLVSAFSSLPSPIDQMTKAFPGALVYNGSVSPKKRIEMQDKFNSDDDGSPRVMIAQGDAMREGVSIHDTTGKRPRVLVHLGMPVKPTASIQQEGRIYRTGQASHAMFRYFTIGTSWERTAFASKIAQRAGAAENLAMGEEARGLKQSFISAYEEADLYPPGFEGEGTGGKGRDRELASALTPWDMAKSFYFGTKQQGKGRSSGGREGKDYFATPEPVGLKMVQWADIRAGEDVLEPSAGHGAIARWFPDGAKKRVIEQSADLASRVALHVDGDVINGDFEDHNIVNKYDAIVMNPPYGQGGSVAVPHLAKATGHLREGGRVVALMPSGPAADKRFDAWFYGQDEKGRLNEPDLHLIADIAMPGVTFERAGTATATRIVVIERVGKMDADKVMPTKKIDLTGADSIKDLFDRLETIEVAPRVKAVEEAAQDNPRQDRPPKEPKAPKLSYAEQAAQGKPKYQTTAPIIEHTTAGGKVLRGVIVTDMTLQEVKDKFYEYAFKKGDGVFLREEFVETNGVKEDGGSYETDLFGNPVQPAGRKPGATKAGKPGVRRDVQPAASVPGDTEAPAGEFHVRTIVGSEVSRKLGADRINSAADLAQATQYLYKSAVERFDAIVTDEKGKPLAVVGNFKGTIDSASVFPATVLAEAVRVPGAANIWFSHNHPSGAPELSQADRKLYEKLEGVFGGSGIEPRGFIAVGRGQFSGTGMESGAIQEPAGSLQVPVIEREQTGEPLSGASIASPMDARDYADAYYSGGKPGIILLNSRHEVIGWTPLSTRMIEGPLRHTGQLRAIYRAISESNVAAAILAHGGELDHKMIGAHDSGMNIASALDKAGVRVLDIINTGTRKSRAEMGESFAGLLMYREGAPGGIGAGLARKLVDQINKSAGGDVVAVMDESELPLSIQRAIERDGMQGRAAGLHDDSTGISYVIASNLRDARHAVEVLVHEVVGHGGIKAVLGGNLASVMRDIYQSIPAEARDNLRARYAGQLKGKSPAMQHQIIAEEYLAHLSETDPKHSAIGKIVALVRKFIRQVFGDKVAGKWSHGDIVQLLVEAKAFVTAENAGLKGVTRNERTGRFESLAGRAGAAARYSGDSGRAPAVADRPGEIPGNVREISDTQPGQRDDSLIDDAELSDSDLDALTPIAGQMYASQGTESPFFKRWFAGSKMVDRRGRPAPFTHRNYGYIDNFDDSMLGKNTGTPSAVLGHYLALRDVNNVERYGPVTETFYVRMKKPKVITQEAFEDMADWTMAQARKYRADLMAAGYDGIYIKGLDWPVVFEGRNIKAVKNKGTFDETDRVRYSVSSETRATYEARVDALFDGKKAARMGVKVLDRADILAVLGHPEMPLYLAESSVNKREAGAPKHKMTAGDWKKVPDWIENPVAAFKSQDGSDRIVLFAPELVAGRPVRIILQPNADRGGIDVHLAVNAYDESGTHITPVDKWVKNGDLLYLDQKQSPAFVERSRLQLPGETRQLRGYGHKVYTEADLVKYRSQADSVRQGTNKQTDTGKFKKWFGDSKVVDADGKPLVVYHGGRPREDSEAIAVFDRNFYVNAGRRRPSLDNVGIWFTENNGAGGLSKYNGGGRVENGASYPVYLSISNPWQVSFSGIQRTGNRLLGRDRNAKMDGEAVDAVRAWMKDNGNDGIKLLHDPRDGDEFSEQQVWIALEPEQIKSAIGNNGDFDPANPDIRYSVDDDTREGLKKLGLTGDASDGLIKKLRAMFEGDIRAKLADMRARSYEGLIDGSIAVKRAEESVGVTDPDKQGYVSMRLATGIADTMHAIMNHGIPVWEDGVIAMKPGSRGLLDVLGDLKGDELTDWLGWLGGKRAAQLFIQGRENNLTREQINAMLRLATGREAKFAKVYDNYKEMSDAILDLMVGADLMSVEDRDHWAGQSYYVPFFREQTDASGLPAGPTTKRGLSHQSAAIRKLTGGEMPTQDLLENILSSWMKRVDASMKNKALIEVVDNLAGSDYLSNQSMKYESAIVPLSQIAKLVQTDRDTQVAVATELGMDEGAAAMDIVNELNKPENKGFAKLWAMVAPTDPDVIRVMRNGKAEYYKVNDPSLTRAVKAMAGSPFNDPITKAGRFFKRLVTTGITASPDFMAANFLRDSVHAWTINPDKFKLGVDSVKGIVNAAKEDMDYVAMGFAGASFQGGYVHGTDPEATAQNIRRSLRKSGMSAEQRASYMASLVLSPSALGSVLSSAWEHYRGAGDKLENANRLQTYKRALEAGKSKKQAAFEARDLMDFNRRGNFGLLVWFTDVIPFMNARIQGLDKVIRAMDGRTAAENVAGASLRLASHVAMKGAYIALFSLLLAGMNDDDERYKDLPDWDKDANWHFWLTDDQVQPHRIPKPFELGILFGTIPERMFHLGSGSQDAADFGKALVRGVTETLHINLIPQVFNPLTEVHANWDSFREAPIEGMADENKLDEARYDGSTSKTAVVVGKLAGPLAGLSPKEIQHLWEGYTGTLGAYALWMADRVVETGMKDTGERPDTDQGDWPVLRRFVGGDGVRPTRYQSELFTMMREADQLHSTIKAYTAEGKVDEAREMRAENRDKLLSRTRLGHARQQLGDIRKRMNRVRANPNMSGAEKRAELNRLQTKANELSKRVALAVEDRF